MKIPMLDLVRQYHQLKAEIDHAVLSVLESGSYIMGPQVKDFEDRLAEFLGGQHCIGVASGSDALLLSLHAMGIGAGDRVIVPSFTFFATAGSVVRMGATPVFVDVEPSTYNMDMEKTAQLMESDRSIKAVIPVHIFGLPVDMARMMELSSNYGVKVIEDACQAINADVFMAGNSRPSKAGTIGSTGCFSFFPSKNLNAYGDAGAIVTNDENLAEQLRILRVHGAKPKYYHGMAGYNSRLDTIQAAVLNVKLNYLNEWTDKRRKVAAVYDRYFQQTGLLEALKWPEVRDGHVFHQYVVECSRRDELAAFLQKRGIATAIYYPVPLHLQPCFQQLGGMAKDCPIAEEVCQRVLALPIDPELRAADIEYIVGNIKDFYA